MYGCNLYRSKDTLWKSVLPPRGFWELNSGVQGQQPRESLSLQRSEGWDERDGWPPKTVAALPEGAWPIPVAHIVALN